MADSNRKENVSSAALPPVSGRWNRPFVPADRQRIALELQKQLGPEYVATRPGDGGRPATYIEGHRAIQIANRIFGFDGWSSEIRSREVMFKDKLPDGRYTVSVSCCMRITLRDGSYREDCGFGSAINQKLVTQAFEKATKEAITDATKRALRQFGDALGNCLKDRYYLSEVSRMVPRKHEFDEENLLRPPTKRALAQPVRAAPTAHAVPAAEVPARVAPRLSCDPRTITGQAQSAVQVAVAPEDDFDKASPMEFFSDDMDYDEIKDEPLPEPPAQPDKPEGLADLAPSDPVPAEGQRAVSPDSINATPTPQRPLSADKENELPALFVSGNGASTLQEHAKKGKVSQAIPASIRFDPSHRSPYMTNVRQDMSTPVLKRHTTNHS